MSYFASAIVKLLSVGIDYCRYFVLCQVWNIYFFCSTHNGQVEAVVESQEAMVEKFMNTSLQYVQAASKNGLYTMVIQCLEVCVCVEMHETS